MLCGKSPFVKDSLQGRQTDCKTREEMKEAVGRRTG